MQNLIIPQGGFTVTTSRKIAEIFTKRHSDVLRLVNNLESNPKFTERNFALSKYKDSSGRTLPEYLITKDGFSFLAMGLTGKKAAKFKVDFIEAFNNAEEKLRESQQSKIPTSFAEALRLVAKVLNHNLGL